MARIPALTGSGRLGQAFITLDKSGSNAHFSERLVHVRVHAVLLSWRNFFCFEQLDVVSSVLWEQALSTELFVSPFRPWFSSSIDEVEMVVPCPAGCWFTRNLRARRPSLDAFRILLASIPEIYLLLANIDLLGPADVDIDRMSLQLLQGPQISQEHQVETLYQGH